MHLKPLVALAFALAFAHFVELRIAAGYFQTSELQALDGEWIYFEDRTEGRALEQQGPPMSAKFSLQSEEGAVVLVSGHGSAHKNVKVELSGAATKVDGASEGSYARYKGAWKEGLFAYETQYFRASDTPGTFIRREFRRTEDGLLVKVSIGSPAKYESWGLYRHAEDIPMPEKAEASISAIAWLAGAWVGTRGSSGQITMEERWSPALGGAMLGVARTVSRGRMSAFEYLRIVEREGGLVYIAQPSGSTPTEFVLSEISDSRAVFENPRHDYPKRIVYSLGEGGALTASIGFSKGGSPRQFRFQRELENN